MNFRQLQGTNEEDNLEGMLKFLEISYQEYSIQFDESPATIFRNSRLNGLVRFSEVQQFPDSFRRSFPRKARVSKFPEALLG